MSETRSDILREIQKKLASFDFYVAIDEKTGVVRLPEAELFRTAQFELTQQGKNNVSILKRVLEDVLPCYTKPKDSMVLVMKNIRCENKPEITLTLFLLKDTRIANPLKQIVYLGTTKNCLPKEP